MYWKAGYKFNLNDTVFISDYIYVNSYDLIRYDNSNILSSHCDTVGGYENFKLFCNALKFKNNIQFKIDSININHRDTFIDVNRSLKHKRIDKNLLVGMAEKHKNKYVLIPIIHTNRSIDVTNNNEIIKITTSVYVLHKKQIVYFKSVYHENQLINLKYKANEGYVKDNIVVEDKFWTWQSRHFKLKTKKE